MKTKLPLLLLFSFLLISCSSDDNSKKVVEKKTTTINFRDKERVLLVEEQLDLKYELIVDNANLSDLEWNSNNSEIVSVDKGTINSKKVGEAIITVLVKGTDKKATIKIIVSEIKLFFKTKEVEIDAKKNKTIDLNEYLVIENADKKDIFWYFNQNEMISIKDGIVEAIGDGEVYVEASLKGTPIRDVILIKIKGIGITSFQISANIYANQLIINTTHKLNVYTYPVGDISTLKWKSSNNDVATVNNEGEVLGKALGNVTITAISPSGSTASVDLQIIPKEVTSITITNNTSVPSKVIGGTTYSLQIQTIPYNTDLSLLEFISSDNSIATVDAKGVVHALKGKRGRITITVRSKESIAVSATQELQIISPFEYVKTVSYLEGHIEQNLITGLATFKIYSGAGNYTVSDFKVFNKKRELIYQELAPKYLDYSTSFSYHFNLSKVDQPYVTYKLTQNEHVEVREEQLSFSF